MSRKRRALFKIEITLLVFLATLTSLTLAFPSVGDFAGAPPGRQDTPIVSDAPQTITEEPPQAVDDAPETPVDTDADSGGVPPSPPEDAYLPEPAPQEDRYITLGLGEHNFSVGDLILVNPDHSYEIPENGNLVSVGLNKSRSYILLDGNAMLAEKVMKPLNEMMDDFYAATGISNILLNSSFRTLAKQQSVFDDWVRRAGIERAELMAAAPGYSEHHTGLAFDLAIYSGGTVSTFKGTGKYAWISENSHKYGFILRYPDAKQNITRTAYEPWHFRYVGVPHAYFIESRGFAYEEYMEYLMRFEFDGSHLWSVYNGVMYEIYYVPGASVPVPRKLDYTISGNNIDGFIVTVIHGPVEPGDLTPSSYVRESTE